MFKRIGHFACGVLLFLTACTQQTENPEISIIDTSYPNNWRGPELTHPSYKMQTGNISCEEKFPEAKYVNPFPIIIQQAKTQRLVMINESHFKPIHRVFIGEIAAQLSSLDYTHYGSEMLGNVDKTEWLNSISGPRGTGYFANVNGFKDYWNEPVYAQVIEKTSKLKYRLFAYEGDISRPPEGTDSLTDYRERLAASNIKKELETFPTEKFLIHAGYHHIKERNDASNIIWMAEHLKDAYPVDPLTISQTECYTEEANITNSLGYSLLTDEAGIPISGYGYDLIIAAPKPKLYRERPLWLRNQLGKQFIDVPRDARFDGPNDFTLITAHRVDRPSPAAPEDIIYRAPHSEKVLALRRGEYTLTISDRNGIKMKTVMINVE